MNIPDETYIAMSIKEPVFESSAAQYLKPTELSPEPRAHALCGVRFKGAWGYGQTMEEAMENAEKNSEAKDKEPEPTATYTGDGAEVSPKIEFNLGSAPFKHRPPGGFKPLVQEPISMEPYALLDMVRGHADFTQLRYEEVRDFPVYSAEQLATLQAKLEQAEKDKAELLCTLHKLACLGNGDEYGNSIGNQIAIDTIAKYEVKK